jgi:uncharacterized protein YndB with AHSA1/START domain
MADFQNERSYEATPAQVFACLRDPARLARWWGPEGFSNTFDVFEFVPGGRWSFTMHGPDGKDYPNESTFGTLEENALVVVHHVVEPRFVLEIALSPEGEGTRLEWRMDFENKDFARNLHDFLHSANEQNLDRLGVELAREG